MYKLLLKDSTVFNLKSIDKDTENYMIIVLDTDMTHDAAISKFTNDNLSYIQILFNSSVLNTYVNFKEVSESSVKDGIITIKLSKSDTKEIIINLRKENEQLKEVIKNVNEQFTENVEQCNNYILEMSDMLLEMSLTR